MLRGLDGIVASHEVEPGRFYLTWDGNGVPVPFQCVRTGEMRDGNPVDMALLFTPGDSPGLWTETVPDYGSMVRLPGVHFRIDPLHATGNERRTSVRAGMILVVGNEVIVTVPLQFRGWLAVNISTGHHVVDRIPLGWVSFSALSLVVDEGDSERVVGGFRAAQ